MHSGLIQCTVTDGFIPKYPSNSHSFAVRVVPPANAWFPEHHKKVRKIYGIGEEELLTYDGSNSTKCQCSSVYVTAAVTRLRWENRNVCETRAEGFTQNDGESMDVILLCWSNALTFSFEEAIRRTSPFHFLLLPLSNRCPMWQCTHSGRQMAEENKFYTMGLTFCGTSVRYLLHTNILAPRILKLCLVFWKVFDPASLIVMLPVSIFLNTLLQMYCYVEQNNINALWTAENRSTGLQLLTTPHQFRCVF